MATCLQNTIDHFPFLKIWRWGFEPKPETIGALFALSLIPLCSSWTLTEGCIGGGKCCDPTVDPEKPPDHHAGATCHCVAAGNAEKVVQECGAHPHFIVVIYDLAALVRKLVWKLVC